MPAPSKPTLTLTAPSSSSFTAAFTGDVGVTHRLFYRQLGGGVDGSDKTGPTNVGDGSLTVTGVADSAQLMVWDVADSGTSYSLPAIGFISLAQSDTILAAVKTLWNSTSGLVSVAGALYANEVPERDASGNPVAVPYTWLMVSKTRYEWTTETLYYAFTELEFNTYCVGAAAAEQAKEVLKTTFDWVPLPYGSSASKPVMTVPIDESVDSEDVRYKDGTLIYRAQTCYQVVVERHLKSPTYTT